MSEEVKIIDSLDFSVSLEDDLVEPNSAEQDIHLSECNCCGEEDSQVIMLPIVHPYYGHNVEVCLGCLESAAKYFWFKRSKFKNTRDTYLDSQCSHGFDNDDEQSGDLNW